YIHTPPPPHQPLTSSPTRRSSDLMSKLVLLLTALVFATPAVTQDQTSGTSSRTASMKSSEARQDPQLQSNKAKKEKKKKNKDTGNIDDVTASSTFSEAVAQSLLEKLADGLEGRSDRLMLSVFDDSKMAGYLNFEQQIMTFFRTYDSFRVHFRISETSTEASKGVALIDFEMEELPRAADGQPVRKRDQLRFEMERGDKGWKIVDLQPRNFFS